MLLSCQQQEKVPVGSQEESSGRVDQDMARRGKGLQARGRVLRGQAGQEEGGRKVV